MADATGTLRVVAGANAGKTLRLHQRVTVIGNTKSADLMIDGDKVSENHASIETGPDGSFVLRNRSAFGTLVNRSRIDVHALADGDRIQIGAAALVEFRAGSSQRTTASAPSGSRRIVIGVLVGAYLIGMLLLAIALEGMPEDSDAGVGDTRLSAVVQETRAMFDMRRKDVHRPSAEVPIDAADATAPYYRVINAQLRGDEQPAIDEQLDNLMTMLRDKLREGSAFERQRRWREAAARYREVQGMFPDPRTPAVSFAAQRLAIIEKELRDEK